MDWYCNGPEGRPDDEMAAALGARGWRSKVWAEKGKAMLVVTAEIWPGGDQNRAFVIGEIHATNTGDVGPYSDYAVAISQLAYEAAGVEVSDDKFELLHERRRGAWELVRGVTAYQQIIKGDTAVALGAVAERASRLLGGPRGAIQFLGRPCSALGDKQPLELLNTREGVDQVLTLLGQVECGIHF